MLTREETIEAIEKDIRLLDQYVTWDKKDEITNPQYNKGVRVMAEIAVRRLEQLRDNIKDE